MIKEFEEYTLNISEDDMEAVDTLRTFLLHRVGKQHSIKGSDLIILLTRQGHNVNAPKLRRYIQYMRAEKVIERLCGGKNGYYIAENEEIWVQYREAFRSRITSMQYTLAAMY